MNRKKTDNKLKNVVFLDRDGVINHDSEDYIKSWSEFKFIDGSLAALKILNDNGFAALIITNQSAVNRKLFPLKTLEDIHRRMKAAIQAVGGCIQDIFFCPHTPEEDCGCRKPRPGLILRAAQTYQIDLASACMIGDTAKDILCGRNAGCGLTILVKTGNGAGAQQILADRQIYPDYVAENLLAAANWIVARR